MEDKKIKLEFSPDNGQKFLSIGEALLSMKNINDGFEEKILDVYLKENGYTLNNLNGIIESCNIHRKMIRDVIIKYGGINNQLLKQYKDIDPANFHHILV